MAKAPSPYQNIRIPLVEVANQRFADTTSLGSASGIVGVGIVGIMIVGATNIGSKDARLINCFPTRIRNPYTGEIKSYIQKRPGFNLLNTPGARVGNAVKVWLGHGAGNKVISSFGDTNSEIFDGTNSLGSITGVTVDITETIISTTPTLVIPSTDGTAWYYPDGGALTQITDADYPGNAALTPTGTFIHLDGYAFIMTTDGRIWNSVLSSVSSWQSTDFISANMLPDKGVGLASYKNRLVAFGKESIEFFENVGNPTGSPLQRIPELFIKLGCPESSLIVNIEDTLGFVAVSSSGGYGVYILDNYAPKKVSYAELDALLGIIGIGNFTASGVKLHGKPLYILSSSTRSFVYSLEDDLWFEWSSPVPLWSKMTGDTGNNIYSVSLIDNATTNGKVFNINQQSIQYLDNDATFTMAVQTNPIDFGTSRKKRISKLWIVADSYSSTNNLDISWSNDDYNIFSPTRTVNLADYNRYISGLGSFRRRSFQFVNTSELACRLEAIEAEIIAGIH